MNTFEQYEELVYLTRLYLSKEVKGHWQIADNADCFAYFKDYALSLRQMPSSALSQKSKKSEENSAKTNQTKAPLPIPSIRKEDKPNEIKQPEVALSVQKDKMHEKEIENEPKLKVESFSLQAIEASSTNPGFSSWQKNIQELFPHIEILTTIPNDQEAKFKASQWKSAQIAVVIATTIKKPGEQEFIDKVAKALQERNFLTKQVDTNSFSQSLSRNLKLIIADRQILGTYRDLQKYYRWDSHQMRHYLGTVPLIILENLDLYAKDNKLKKELWNSLKAALQI